MKGYKVLRFWDNDVLKDIKAVLEMILQELAYPHPDPLPKRERGRVK
jgi:very-short-patch-repair endonuclease